MKKLVFIPVVVLVAALSLPGPAYAGEAEQGQIIIGGSFTLESGDELNGELVIFGGSVELEQGSVVDGDVLSFGGNAEFYSEINGNLALFGGNMDLGPSAVITGDLVTLGGNVNRGQDEVVCRGRFHIGRGFLSAIRLWTPQSTRFWRRGPYTALRAQQLWALLLPGDSALVFIFDSCRQLTQPDLDLELQLKTNERVWTWVIS